MLEFIIIIIITVIVCNLWFPNGTNSILSSGLIILFIYFFSLSNGDLEVISQLWSLDTVSLYLIWIMLWVVGVTVAVSHLPAVSSVYAIGIVALILYSTSQWIVLFMCFEVSVIPLIWLIITQSSHPERISALTYLVIYTVLASFPLLVFILSESNGFTTGSLILLKEQIFFNTPLSYLSIIPFLVNIPVFLLHGWLVNAHVEAPVEGSIVLAGVLLKFGAYGLYRTLTLATSNNLVSLSLLGAVSLIGSGLSAALALMSPDINQCVAYSSVSHISLSLGALCELKSFSLSSFILVIISHSLVSCLLFYYVTCVYKLLHSRSVVLTNGAYSLSSISGGVGFLCWTSNIGIPLTLSFWGEVFSILVLSKISYIFVLFCITYMTVSGLYCVVMFCIHSSPSTCPSPVKLVLETNEEILLSTISLLLPLYTLYWLVPLLS